MSRGGAAGGSWAGGTAGSGRTSDVPTAKTSRDSTAVAIDACGALALRLEARTVAAGDGAEVMARGEDGRERGRLRR